MFRSILLLSFSIVFFQSFFAQNSEPLACGTDPESHDWFLKFQENRDYYRTITEDTLYVPMTVHLVGSDEGAGFYSFKALLQDFCILNDDFSKSGIVFYLDSVNYVKSSILNDHEDFSDEANDVIRENHVPNTLNAFITDEAAGNCGYYWGVFDAVVLAENCIGPTNHTWAHEMGHYLSLPHTFWGWEGTSYKIDDPKYDENSRGVEYVDGSNCEDSGDRFCDTPADYYSFRWPCGPDSMSQKILVDPQNDTFRVDGKYFMSYSYDECTDRFSEDEMAAMRANLVFERPDLNYLESGLEATDTVITGLIPTEGDTILYTDAAFSWSPVKNATHYEIAISIFPSVANPMIRETVTDTFFHVDALPINFKVYWRIFPYSIFSGCNTNYKISSFQTIEPLAVNPISTIENTIKVYPSLLKSGEMVNIKTGEVSGEIIWNWLDQTGLPLTKGEIQANQNRVNNRILVPDFAPGMYFLTLSYKGGLISKKMIIL